MSLFRLPLLAFSLFLFSFQPLFAPPKVGKEEGSKAIPPRPASPKKETKEFKRGASPAADTTSPVRGKSKSPPRSVARSAASVPSFTDETEDTSLVPATSLVGFQPQYPTKVTDKEWAMVTEKLIPLHREVMKIDAQKQPEAMKLLALVQLGQDLPPEIAAGLYTESVNKHTTRDFRDYFRLYKELVTNESKALARIGKDAIKDFFMPVRAFCFVFEDLFDTLYTHYNKTETGSSFLERDYFPIVQRTFNVIVRAWEKLTGQNTTLMGPLEPKVKTVINDEYRDSHLWYKRDTDGFLLFAIKAHQPLGDPAHQLFYTYIPFRRDLAPAIEHHAVIFSCVGSTPAADELTPLRGLLDLPSSLPSRVCLIDNPGLRIERQAGGKFFAIKPYTGGFGCFPYTEERMLGVFNDADLMEANANMILTGRIKADAQQKEKDKQELEKCRKLKASIDQSLTETPSDEGLLKLSREIQEKIEKLTASARDIDDLKTLAEKIEEVAGPFIPEAMKGLVVFQTESLELDKRFGEFQPQMVKWIQGQLGEYDQVFIPFPKPGIEEMEVEYLALQELQQHVKAGSSLTTEDQLLLTYLQEEFRDQPLDQIVEAAEQELMGMYTSEEQARIKEEWAAREKAVIDGRVGSKPKTKRKSGSKHKQKREKEKAKQAANGVGGGAGEKSSPSSAAAGSAPSGLGLEATPDISEEALRRAGKRFEKLKTMTLGQKGPLDFRRYKQFINCAAQGLAHLGHKSEVSLSDESSHGSARLGDDDPFTAVRPHGPHDALHPRGKKTILGVMRRTKAKFMRLLHNRAPAPKLKEVSDQKT